MLMYNPLFPNVSPLKDADIELKMTELNKKYNLAAKMGNAVLCQQIATMISLFKDETATRQASAARAFAEKHNKDLGDLINIG